MTRFLSESLQAPEPFFRLHLQRLEQAHGHPSADIRLTSVVNHNTRIKMEQLGLDPSDTTPAELYAALKVRLTKDDAQLKRRLRTIAAINVSAEADVVAGMAHALESLPLNRTCYGLKAVSFKRLVKAQPPKKAMKALGYRSIDSMLRQEPMAVVLAITVISESPAWQKQLHDSYRKLTPRDFENRQLSIVHPQSTKWRSVSAACVATQKHNLMSFPEIGAIVLLPLPDSAPSGVVTASMALALHAINELRASSTYLKLCQVRPDFGTIVKTVATQKPQLQTHLLDKQVPWQLVQRYYARLQQHFRDELFEPHIKLSDLSWHGVEQAMSLIEPNLHFWQNSPYLGLIHQGRGVSLNIVDVALNVCNKIQFDDRLQAYFQKSLWHELLLQYMKPATVEQTVLAELQPQLAYAPAQAY